jgi:hypothetical protein
MPRKVAWIERLREIRQSVENSVRSHYTRAELQVLFRIQPRAANNLMDLMPTVRIGRSLLVEKAALGKFLEEMMAAEDVAAVRHQRKAAKEDASRKRPRHMVRRDLEPVGLASVPSWIKLERGRLVLEFQTTQQLGEGMLMLARILESDGDEFAARFEPEQEAVPDNGVLDVRAMFRELEEMEVSRAYAMDSARTTAAEDSGPKHQGQTLR